MAELICGKHHYNGILIKTPCPICTVEEDTGTTSEDIVRELEPRIEAAEAEVARRRPFLEAAMAYCENKVEYLRLKREILALPRDWQHDADSHGHPCWLDGAHDDYRHPDERCEACEAAWPLVEQRRVLGLRMSGLAQKMYAEYRKLEAGDG